MEQTILRAFEARCTQEEPPACQTQCPLHVETRPFIRHMAGGRLAEARKILERAMPLAGLTGLLCDGRCMPHCRRAEVDGGVNLPLLERSCVLGSAPSRPLALPGTGKAVAVAGAGLSSLVLAFELGKKGHKVTLHHTGEMDAWMRGLDAGRLGPDPEAVIRQTMELLTAVRVTFAALPAFDRDWCEAALAQSRALYLGLDDPAVRLDLAGLTDAPQALTLETTRPEVFAGGAPGEQAAPFILAAADGKRAAGSITRLLQGVSPSSAREHEDVYPSLLFTDISGVSPAPPVAPANASAPSLEEAKTEAARCIQCECLECVKRCVYLARYKGYPKRYAREIYNNLAMVHGVRKANTQINSCTGCGLCAAVCPNQAHMGAFCATARREMVRGRRMPASAHEFALEDMAHSNAPDISFFRHQPGQQRSAFALFPGCQLPASLPEQTERLYASLCDRLEGGVGLFFHCCGAPARWSGREKLTASTAANVRQSWENAGNPTLILACASCLAFFQAELPDIPVRSLWEVLAELPLPEDAVRSGRTLALHDPCAARETPATRAGVRRLLAALGQETEELPLGRELTRCCGYGGLADAANPDMGRAYAQSRAQDTDNILLAYCAMCRDRLAAVGAPVLHMLELLFPFTSGKAAPAASTPSPSGPGSPDPADYADRPPPGISLRQETRLAFRRNLLQSLWNEPPQRNPRMDALTLHISDEVERKLEARRILHSDLKTVLLHAAEHGAQFHNPAANRSLACLRPRQVTFWVEYTQHPDASYTIHDAYCHRMVVPGVPGEGKPTAVILEGYDPMGGRV